MSGDCVDCGKSIGKNGIKCSAFCSKEFCKRCARISDYDINVLKHDNIIFVCNECKVYMKNIMDKMDNMLKIVSKNEMALCKQEEEIRGILNCVKIISERETNNKVKNVNKKKTYAKIAVKNIPPIIIKPNNKQNSEETKAEIKEKIKPADLALQVRSLTKSSNGSIMIKCTNEESIKKIEDEVKDKLGEKYNVNIPSLVSPKIVVIGIDKEIKEDELIE